MKKKSTCYKWAINTFIIHKLHENGCVILIKIIKVRKYAQCRGTLTKQQKNPKS